MLHRRSLALALLLTVTAACGGGDATDAALDASGDVMADGGASIAPAAPPVLTPCAEGFREVVLPELEVTVCEPWPERGRQECGPFESHFPGEPGCVLVGDPCPTSGRFAPDLPADARVFYVDPAAPAGGDGSLGAPYDTLAAAVRNAGADQIIALAAGEYDEAPRLRPGVILWGACVAETVIAPSAALGLMGAVTSTGEIDVKNLRITGARPGVGAFAAEEAVNLEGVWIEGSWGYAVAASNGGRITVRGSHLGTPTYGGIEAGTTVVAQNGGHVELAQVEIVEPLVAGVAAEGEGGLVTLDHVVIRDALGEPRDGLAGRGATASTGGRVEMRASVIENVAELGGLSREVGSSFVIEDSVIRNVRAQGDGLFGRGFTTQAGGEGTLERVFLDDTEEAAIIVLRSGRLAMLDTVVRRVRPATFNGGFGTGVAVTDGHVSLARMAIVEARAAGLNIVGESTGDLVDVSVYDVLGQESGGVFGRGLNVFRGASVVAERVRILRTRDVGVFVDGATLELRDLVLREVAEQVCSTTTCPRRVGGIGVGIYRGGDALIERFSIEDASIAGVQVAGGELTLRDGEVASCPIGANIQDESFDIARISDGVVYRDNGINLDAERLPVPEAPGFISE